MLKRADFFACLLPILSFAALAGSEPDTSFHQIVRTDDFAKIKQLIAEGANVNEPDQNGFTPLQHAAKYGNETAVKLLIDSGANIEVKAEDGRSLLHLAALNPRTQVAGVLIDSGSNINSVNKTGVTPLHDAVYYRTLEMVKFLVERGADINKSNAEGRTSLHFAVSRAIKELNSLSASGDSFGISEIDLSDIDTSGLDEETKAAILEAMEAAGDTPSPVVIQERSQQDGWIRHKAVIDFLVSNGG